MTNTELDTWKDGPQEPDRESEIAFLRTGSSDAGTAWAIYGSLIRPMLGEQCGLREQSDAELGMAYLSGDLTTGASDVPINHEVVVARFIEVQSEEALRQLTEAS
jgi:hypothetical protein